MGMLVCGTSEMGVIPIKISATFMMASLWCMVASLKMKDSSLIVEMKGPISPMALEMPISLMVDLVSLMFFGVITMISSVVFLYSKFYMAEIKSKNMINNRFFWILSLFVISMGVLVFSSSWVSTMMGWDGLGVVSFLLVVFYSNPKSMDSGLVTLLTNRLGDCFFILSTTFMVYSGWMSANFLCLENIILFPLIIGAGCITKSAQVPFSSWLPAAMAAPTPVSSLVHSSTLVTAGVYLTIRFNHLLKMAYPALMILSVTTMVLGGLCASYELDFKKVVAMSTLSQLGLMMYTISNGMWALCFLHMVCHAFFKSSLFLSTGSLMHLIAGDQDSRNFGSLGSSQFSKMIFSMSVLSLMGFPFTMGFYSKDSILMAMSTLSMSVLHSMFLMGCCLTVSYSMRLIDMAFNNFPSFKVTLNMKEAAFFYVPIIILYGSCGFSGNLLMNMFSLTESESMSLPELFLGLLVILLGSVLQKMMALLSYSKMKIIYYMGFLTLISSPKMSSKLLLMSHKKESTWLEIWGGMGTKKLMGEAIKLPQFYKVKLLLVFISMVVYLLT